ncbi:hypothetical protein GQ600_20660 [Phytophthora cactorum]|nr:hypothetical protein GQ600_20660 [Phytophthora cactorum]
MTVLNDQVARLTQRLVKKTNEPMRYQQEELQEDSDEQKQLVAAIISQALIIQQLREIVLNRLETTPPSF